MNVKFKKRNDGFTLVELVVVIAILGILAGVGTVGYSGYINSANKAADQQLVSDIVYAAELAKYSGASMEGTQAVTLQQGEDAKITGTWMEDALKNVFGENPAQKMQLKYGKWGSGAATTGEVLDYFGKVIADDESVRDAGIKEILSGTAKPSFANEVDDLFGLVRDTAITINGGLEGTSGAELIQGAAGTTTNGKLNSADAFAKVWNSQAWQNDLMGTGESYNKDEIDKVQDAANKTDEQKKFLDNAIANAGVIKARNTSLAIYLKNNNFPELYDLFANYSYGGSIIPKDAAGIYLENNAENADEKNALIAEIKARCPAEMAGYEDGYIMFVGEAMRSYYGVGLSEAEKKQSQGYKDGLAYYTMMSTVDSVPASSSDDDTYWDEMAGAVSLYGSIARGETSVGDLNAIYADIPDGAVVITVTGSGIYVGPQTAMPG